MNRTLLALVVKYLMTFVFAWLIFGMMLSNSMTTIALVALIATAGNYFLGDLLILPAFGNIVAAIGDGLLGVATFYLAAVVTRDLAVDVRSLFLFGVLILIGEYFFHRYLLSSEKVEP